MKDVADSLFSDSNRAMASDPLHLLQEASVLVVDDADLTRRIVGTLLRRAGARVEEASSGTEALRLASEMKPDLIVLDVELPDVRGPEVARRLKQRKDTASVAILHLSATHVTSEAQALGLNLGADAYMVQPFEPEVLLSTVGALLRMKRAVDRVARLQSFTAAVGGVETPEAVTALVLEEGVQAAQAAGAALALAEGGALKIVGTSRGWPAGLGKVGPAALDASGPIGICVWTGEPVWLASAHALALDYPQLVKALPPSLAVACIPMKFGGRTRGAVAFSFPASHVFTEAEQQFLLTLVAGCTMSLERGTARAAERRALEEQRRVEQALRSSIRARNDLVAIVSHDLRGPLGVVTMGIELIRSRVEAGQPIDPPQIRTTVERILRSSQRMTVLVSDLLDAASIEAGTFTLEREPQALLPILGDVVEQFEPAAREKSILLDAGIEGQPVARCDRKRMVQILANLVGNAIKFTPTGGSIHVSARADGARTIVSVADTGVGIPDDQLPHLFDRYWTGRQNDAAGTGLGLFIVKGLVEAHGGRIEVASRLGAGTTFTFSLPAG